MLQSEFFERTKVNLTPEEYSEVEKLYNGVQMGKDDFCKHWLKLRNNPLFFELGEAFKKAYAFGGLQISELTRIRKEMAEKEVLHEQQMEEKDRFYRDEMEKEQKRYGERLTEFAKRIIRANEEGDLRVYDVLEEECGIAFIIRTKHEAGIALSEDEIKYMVGKL